MICGEIAFFTLNEWYYRKGFDSLKSKSLKWFHSSIQSQFHLDDREHCDGLTRRKKIYLILLRCFWVRRISVKDRAWYVVLIMLFYSKFSSSFASVDHYNPRKLRVARCVDRLSEFASNMIVFHRRLARKTTSRVKIKRCLVTKKATH